MLLADRAVLLMSATKLAQLLLKEVELREDVISEVELPIYEVRLYLIEAAQHRLQAPRAYAGLNNSLYC